MGVPAMPRATARGSVMPSCAGCWVEKTRLGTGEIGECIGECIGDGAPEAKLTRLEKVESRLDGGEDGKEDAQKALGSRSEAHDSDSL